MLALIKHIWLEIEGGLCKENGMLVKDLGYFGNNEHLNNSEDFKHEYIDCFIIVKQLVKFDKSSVGKLMV